MEVKEIIMWKFWLFKLQNILNLEMFQLDNL